MARGTTLVKLLDMYRAECRISFNSAHNNQDLERQIRDLQKTQEYLWEDYDWPMMRVERRIDLQAGQRYYSLPDDLHIDRISKAEVFYDTVYTPLKAGIDAEHYSAYNSDLDERQWPPQRWRIAEDNQGGLGQFEIWPLPESNADTVTLEGTVKLTGIRNLNPLVENSDRADLDDWLIVLYAAADYLTAKGDKSAPSKQQMANSRYAKLRGGQSPRRKFKMFGVGQPEIVRRVPIAIYNKTS
jgi:hypothetical protein